MAVIIEQFFPQGRFHATRWRENPFADSYLEWPPSPWRLLRALAARWFQYSRETGDRDSATIERLLGILASKRPDYYLPPAIRGPVLKQYQPLGEHSWSDPSAGSGAVKKAKTTLFPDACFAIDPKQPLIWQWPEIHLDGGELDLLAQLLARVTYFGRAESRSRLALSARDQKANCLPAAAGNAPVLCFAEGMELDLGVLLCGSDEGILKNSPAPPGTEWVFYERPERALTRMNPATYRPQPTARFRHVQFALGGHVLPKIPYWIKITERFRGRVLRAFNGSPDLLRILSGKEAEGRPLRGSHDHAFYLLWPDEDSEAPSRLIVWRRGEMFHADEVKAMMLAALGPIPWARESEDWSVQLLPLPDDMPLPRRFIAKSRIWESATPFVRPHNRHFRRSNGKIRVEEEPEIVCGKLIEKVWGVRPLVERISTEAPWVKLHETAVMRKERARRENRTPHVGPGYYLRVTFAEEFQGPLIVGDSAHFGLGVFRSAAIQEKSTLILSARETEAVIDTIQNPPEPGPVLQAAARHYRKTLETK